MLPRHRSEYLQSEMRALGFKNITTYPDSRTTELGDGIEVTVILNPAEYIEDSALLFNLNGFKVLNLNDCLIMEDYCRILANEGIDLAFMQFSGAQYYPVAYEYGLNIQKMKSKEFLNSLMSQFKNRVEWLKPKSVCLSAGPPCFLENLSLNFDSIFPDANEFISDLTRQIIPVNAPVFHLWPGQRVEIPSMDIVGPTAYQAYLDKAKYLEDYYKDRSAIVEKYLSQLPSPDHVLYLELARHLRTLVFRSIYIAGKVQAVILFRITGAHAFNLAVDLRTPHCRMIDLDKENVKPNYIFKIDSKYLLQVLNHDLLWEELLLSLRVQLKREPDVYNWPFFALLRFGYSTALLRIIESTMKMTSEEFIKITYRDKVYEIGRFCPHAGEDLTNGVIDDGAITCPRHFWKFDLNTGVCIAGGSMSLESKVVKEI
jgi:UDP-MurNAc hydroxylase